MNSSKPPRLAIINTSAELIEVLTIAFQDENFEVISMVTPDFKTGRLTVPRLIKTHHPDVTIYDVGIPYEENWFFFKKIVKQFQDIPVILTTTNKDALESLVGPTGAFEIVGKPYDLFKLIDLVKSKLPT